MCQLFEDNINFLLSSSINIFNKSKPTPKMGSQCFSTTPNELYSSYLSNLQVSELKDHWPTLKVYKIKKIYDKASSTHPQYSKHTHLTFENFKKIFPGISSYHQNHKKRVFEIFDFDSQGFVDWNNFYSSISICYFAPTRIMAILMFMIFDDHLTKELDRNQLSLLFELNRSYLKSELNQQDEQELVSLIMGTQPSLQIDKWLQKAQQYLDFEKFKRIFNLFAEEKMEKELVQNFSQWNNLYNQQQQRYISYVISYKWFQAWKIYVLEEYGVVISWNCSKTITSKTVKSIRTKKSIKEGTKNSQKIAQGRLKLIKVDYEPRQPTSYPQMIKNLDFVHNNIGQRPRQIYNNVLEGEYEQVLKPELIENRDFIFVSQRVWQSLKAIYQGFPEFRRTGYDIIQLNPKVVKIYSSIFRDQIDYSSEVLREVSSYLTVQQLLIKSVGMKREELQKKTVFFKAAEMIKWQELTDLSYMFTQLSPQVIIFLIYLDKAETEVFRKVHQKIAKEVTEINVGDWVKFQDNSLNQVKIQKDAIFMGKNTEGKYVLHFPGQSYIYDICVVEEEFFKKSKILSKNIIQDIKLKKKADHQLVGIPNIKGTGFINSCIIHLLKNGVLREAISLIQADKDGNMQIIGTLSQINALLSQRKKVDGRAILDMIEIMMPDYQNFQMSMCGVFLDDFLTHIRTEMKDHKMKDIIMQQYTVNVLKKAKCGKCNKISELQSSQTSLSLPIPQKNENYYEVIYVPFNRTLRSTQIKRYGFTLPSNALLKDYKAQFQKIAEINSTQYILVEVYNNNVVKNFMSANKEATLSKLLLRETDQIYAFQLCVSFDQFISDHYSVVKDIQNKDFKIDQFVDCKNDQRGWIFGKIRQIQFLPYTHQMVLRVLHKFSKNQQWEISYDLCDQVVANFPTKSYLNGQQYHIRLLQRYFNESTNDMQVCQMPLVVVLPNWMRWKEFYYLIYLQMKRFIHQDYRFQDQNDKGQIGVLSSKSIEAKSPRNKNAVNNGNNSKAKLNKFKEYLSSPQFPYTLSFVDRDGRCIICLKFLKTRVLKGQTQNYCQGCNLSQAEPISWQVKAIDIMVCVDWKSLNYLKKDIIKDHSSYANLLMIKKNDFQTLQNCLQNRINNQRIEETDMICCSQLIKTQVIQNITNRPQNLTIYLQRIIEQNGFKKTIMKHVSFDLEDLTINEDKYSLIGVTSVQGNNKNTKYKAYLLNSDGEWSEYDGQIVKNVKKIIVQKVCALVLYYKLNQPIKPNLQ